MGKTSSFARKLAKLAFIIALTTFLTSTFAVFYAHGGPRIAAMKITRWINVSGMGLGALLGIICLLIIMVQRVLRSHKKAIGLSIGAILLGSLGIWGQASTWDTEFGREEAANRAVCAINLKTIDTAMCRYANDHGDKYPPPENWQQILIEGGYIRKKDIKCFICPSVGGNPRKECSYIYRGPAAVRTSGDWFILYEHKKNHNYPKPFGRNVVNGGHGVTFLSEEEFQERIRKENAERKKYRLPVIPAQD